MSLGYPTLRPERNGAPEKLTQPRSNFGVHNSMLLGTPDSRTKNEVTQLEYSEKMWHANKEKMDFVMLKNSQGIHAPLKLKMERNSARHVGRLRGLTSSNLMLDTLTGRLDTIEFDDILNNPTDCEVKADMHVQLEKEQHMI